MGYMAKWGPKGFLVSTKKIVVMEGLTTSLTLKQDSENDTSGTQPTNTRGRELRPISFSVTYMAAAGVDPRGQIAEWEAQLGNAYPLYIGGQRFGAEKMKLTGVETSDILLTNTGKFLQATIKITLEEYSSGATSKLTSTSPTTSKGNANALVSDKEKALAAAASKTNKANLKKTIT